MAAFNLLDQLAFYGAYHNNRWNKLIHFIFVPAIIWSLLLCFTPVRPECPDTYCNQRWPVRRCQHQQCLCCAGIEGLGRRDMGLPVVLNASSAVVALYSLFYLTLEPVAGLTWGLFTGIPLWLSATWFRQEVDNAWMWAIPVHILGWFMQIVPGHTYFEQRKPALLDSLVQAFALAPLFVWFELLFVIGYRPGLHRQLQARVDKAILANKMH